MRALIMRGEDTSSLQGMDIEMAEGDVLDPQSLARAFLGVDTVYHLAGIISIMPGRNPFVWKVNVEGTRNVLAEGAPGKYPPPCLYQLHPRPAACPHRGGDG